MKNILSLLIFLSSNCLAQIDLHYHDNHRAARPILFIHGFGASSFTWRKIAPSLEKTYRVITVDLKGFGKSPKPSDDDYTPADQATLVYSIIQKLHLDDLTLVGHSYGGGIALLTLFKDMDKDGHHIRGLILMDAASYPQKLPLFISILRYPFIGPAALKLLPSEFQSRNILEKSFYQDNRIEPEAIREYAKPLQSPRYRRALVKVARSMIPMNMESLIRRYNSIHVPTLIIWGKNDEITPFDLAKQLVNDIPNSKLAAIDNCGHIPQEEAPEQTLDIIKEYLAKSS